MKKLLKYLTGSYLKETILSPLFKMLEALLELFVPIVVGAMIDGPIALGDKGGVISCCLVLAGMGLVGLGFSVTAQYFAAKAAAGFAKNVSHALFSHIQTLSYTDLDEMGTSTLITRMTGDLNQVQSGVNLTLRLLLRSPFVVFGAMIMAFLVDARSALVFAAAIPVLALVVFGIMLVTIPMYNKVRARLDKVLGRTRENLTGVRVIRAFRKENDEISAFDAENAALTAEQKAVGRISALMNPLTLALINIAVAVLVYIGALRVEAGIITQGAVVALYNYMSQILVELIKLANLIINITRSAACGRRISAALEFGGNACPVTARLSEESDISAQQNGGDGSFAESAAKESTRPAAARLSGDGTRPAAARLSGDGTRPVTARLSEESSLSAQQNGGDGSFEKNGLSAQQNGGDGSFAKSAASGNSPEKAVEFKNVSLRYRGAAQPSLSGISFAAEKGSTIGVIGGTGSGKTSLISMIPRFYGAESGEVLVNGRNVDSCGEEELRAKVGIVPQKAVLFKGTIRENMKWGNENASDEEIFRALELAQAKEIVEGKPGGLDFEIEQGGRNLSGGQRQRLTIARALVKKPEILILDDSASALDFATDAALRRALRTLSGVTVFIVSQRTSSIRHADRIIVLDDGEAVGIGTHDELLESCGTYREIYRSQFKKEGA